MLWSGTATFVVGMVVKVTWGLRVEAEHEVVGIDVVKHGETAYDLWSMPVLRREGLVKALQPGLDG